MHLGGQGAGRHRVSPRRRNSEGGYAMAVLLVGMAVMAILMSAAMPVWRQASQREKEEEYLWRANQYARAIVLFGRKRANAMPASIDELLSSNNEKYLRKKYKDPITGEDFELVRQGTTQMSLPGQGAGRGGAAGAISSPTQRSASDTPTPQRGSSGQTFGGGPVIGVVSKSKAESIRTFKGRTHYNEWIVTRDDYRSPLGGVANQQQMPGRGGPNVPGRGGPNFPGRGGPGPGQGPGGPTFPRGGPPTGPGGQPFPFPMPPGRGGRGGQ
jgi:type II secretory pathway pseudopilin PulG